MSVLRRFFHWNERLYLRLERHMPYAHESLRVQAHYNEIVGRLLNERPGQIAVDVGAGKRCPFAEFRDPAVPALVVGIDVSREEIADNPDLSFKLVADVYTGLPFADGSVDMVVSRSVLEHLRDVPGFAREAARVLKPGGRFVHLLPSRYAPFAVINRILPQRVARRLLCFCWPEVRGICGFPAYYDRCSPSAMTKVLRQNGFEIRDLQTAYYQSFYFRFFVPLFLLSMLYEIIIHALRARNLGSHFLICAVKKDSPDAE
jgi:SAM-dependent methyltransferase